MVFLVAQMLQIAWIFEKILSFDWGAICCWILKLLFLAFKETRKGEAKNRCDVISYLIHKRFKGIKSWNNSQSTTLQFVFIFSKKF